MTTFVLVHGSWHGSWCWCRVVPELEALGHRVLALDLPGHGDDATPVARITLAAYAECVAAVVRGAAEPVVLVGHSFGGIVISQAAELIPERISRLVILNAPHPVPFARALVQDPAQRQASEYMNRLRAPGSEARLAENDFQRLDRMLTGFSPRNLKYMRAFAKAWPEEPIVQQLAAQIPWFHNCVLLDKVKARQERDWYILPLIHI